MEIRSDDIDLQSDYETATRLMVNMKSLFFFFLLRTILQNLPSTRGRSYSHHVSTGINICFSREERSEADNFLFQILALLYFSVVFSHIYNHVLAINIVHWGVVTHVTTKHFVWISKLIKCKSKSVEIEFILMCRNFT